MKKLVVLLSLFFAVHVSAQQTFRAGLLGGLNGCQIHGDNDWGFHKAGLVLGGFIASDPSQQGWWQLEMELSMKGSRKFAHPDRGDYTQFEYRLNYVDVPFTVHFNLKSKAYIELGASLDYLINARLFDANGEVQLARPFRKLEFAVLAGAGYKFNDHWNVNLRSSNSLFPVLKFDSPVYYPSWFQSKFNKGMYNNILSLTLQYRFSPKGDNSGS